MNDNEKKHIASEKKRWNKAVTEKIRNRAERKESFSSPSGIELERLYSPADIDGSDYLGEIGFPGEYPFTRGIQPTMYRGRFWTMRQYAGFGSAEETNKRFQYLLEQGQTGLSVAFDLPTQIGYDSDNPLSKGEVGKVGVAIDSLEDMEILFENIPLEKVSTSMTINSTASILLGFYIALARKRGIKENQIRGTIQNDILKEYVARGTYIYPPAESIKLTTDVFSYCRDNVPNWNTISISGYHIREAGATAVQELAFTFSNAIAYVEAAVKAGMEVDSFASRLSFFFNAHNNLLEEVSKFRAARRIWSSIMKNRFGAKEQKSLLLRFHTQTAGSTLTARQPENNVVRVCIQALAAVLGGTQSLHTNSRDEALSLPTEQSALIALRTQQIIAHESGVADTVDLMGGSYAVEALTDEIESKVMDYIARIDDMGGSLEAVKSGFMEREIQESAYRQQKDIEEKKDIVVGVNSFEVEEESQMNLLRVNPAIEEAQNVKLKALRAGRNQALVDLALKKLEEDVKAGRNTMTSTIEACSAYATLGEISNVFRSCFGEYEGN